MNKGLTKRDLALVACGEFFAGGGVLFVCIMVAIVALLCSGCTFAPQVTAFNNRTGASTAYAADSGYNGQALDNNTEAGATIEGNTASIPVPLSGSPPRSGTPGGGLPHEDDDDALVVMPPHIDPSDP